MVTSTVEADRIRVVDLDMLVDDDNVGLSHAMRLLSTRVVLDLWDPALRRALAGAVNYHGPNRREATKADRLLRHLFGEEPSPLHDDDADGDRLADRLRADLADLVPFGAGMHLVSDSEVHAWTGNAR